MKKDNFEKYENTLRTSDATSVPSQSSGVRHNQFLSPLIRRTFPACCQPPMISFEVANHKNPLLLKSSPIVSFRNFCFSRASAWDFFMSSSFSSSNLLIKSFNCSFSYSVTSLISSSFSMASIGSAK